MDIDGILVVIMESWNFATKVIYADDINLVEFHDNFLYQYLNRVLRLYFTVKDEDYLVSVNFWVWCGIF